MSPGRNLLPAHRARFPRVSGDEPLKGKAIVSFDPFSPRERG